MLANLRSTRGPETKAMQSTQHQERCALLVRQMLERRHKREPSGLPGSELFARVNRCGIGDGPNPSARRQGPQIPIEACNLLRAIDLYAQSIVSCAASSASAAAPSIRSQWPVSAARCEATSRMWIARFGRGSRCCGCMPGRYQRASSRLEPRLTSAQARLITTALALP